MLRTMEDVTRVVRETLGDNVDDFDVEGIAAEAYDYVIDRRHGVDLGNTARFEQNCSDEEYWEIVAKHDLSVEEDVQADAQWTKPDWEEQRPFARVEDEFVATMSKDSAVARVWLGTFDSEITLDWSLERGRDSWSSKSPQDWPKLEKFLPRTGWPVVMGKTRKGGAAIDPELREILVEAIITHHADAHQVILIDNEDEEDAELQDTYKGEWKRWCGSVVELGSDLRIPEIVHLVVGDAEESNV